LVLVGDGPLRSDLTARARALGIESRVTFAGNVPHRDVPDVLRSLTVYAQPSFSEGEPRALLEAEAIGLPAVVSDIPAHRGIVGDEQTALVVPADDTAAWAKAFRRILDDAAFAAQLGSAARERVVAEHEFGLLLDRFADFLRSARAK
jgi:glycosyltransferase involved in cell wall biosynthesis